MRKFNSRAVGKGAPGRGGHHFLEEFFFHVKSETVKFLQGKKIRDLSLFIEQDISDKK